MKQEIVQFQLSTSSRQLGYLLSQSQYLADCQDRPRPHDQLQPHNQRRGDRDRLRGRCLRSLSRSRPSGVRERDLRMIEK